MIRPKLSPFFFIFFSALGLLLMSCEQKNADHLKANFINPPDSARPGVYWYFMDGNLSREGITADLESMKKAGIGNVLFLEVNVGVPRGKVDFLSDEWLEIIKHAISECERLGIEFTLGSGPGWAGSGGPWVKPEQSMRHLVASSTPVNGLVEFSAILEKPKPKRPYFGEGVLTDSLKKQWESYYEDVFVLAFPTPDSKNEIQDIDEKALYYRAPYTSVENVKQFLPAPEIFNEISGSSIDINKIVDLTGKLQADGQLNWNVPAGNWTIMRFGLRNNGAVTRPAPMPGLGFEADKFDTTHFNSHFDDYIGKIIQKTGARKSGITAGWTMIHIDSWEMGAQNWSDNFREEFIKRRKYDPLKYLPVYAGKIVESTEISERFLWDVRQTAMELVVENHAGHFKELGRRNGFTLSIEPYDMNPAADLVLGAVADVPMCEFWTKGRGFNSAFSCIEATSIAHVYGRPVVAAESFTADDSEAWKMYPGNVKNQGDWAFCMGINKFVYHTFAHQPLNEKYLPGMTMGPYGVHWDRHQTWWPMADAYHKYVTRCQYILRQGRAVADILYLTPEGAPHVFRAPKSALAGDEVLPDKRGYSFDGVSPTALIELADVKDNNIVFPGGASYKILVLPNFKTMTPELLHKIEYLLKNGARIIGAPPVKSPGLAGYPGCDSEVEKLALQIWGTFDIPGEETETHYGQGNLFWGGTYCKTDSGEIFPSYKVTENLLKKLNVSEDFSASGSLRYTHRITEEHDIYFVSNRTDTTVEDICAFRVRQGVPEIWDPVTGETRFLTDFKSEKGLTSIPLHFDRHQSYFIVFSHSNKQERPKDISKPNFPVFKTTEILEGKWQVSFDAKWGGPENITFDSLTDWSVNQNEGIKYYSGMAKYSKTFDLESSVNSSKNSVYLNLGEVKNMARITLNGKNLGILWTSPWRLNISEVIKNKGNKLEIEVVNLWGNRLTGDEQLPDDGVKDGEWPAWLLNDEPRTSGRFTFAPRRFYQKDSPLQSSGLMGPVYIEVSE
ncbi:MAG TPA: glycosyl hydrolase [Draconibacterium sp.]|nr:glycosyl hydrolase [Draconibacterium sp.]